WLASDRGLSVCLCQVRSASIGYSLSLHDALPISRGADGGRGPADLVVGGADELHAALVGALAEEQPARVVVPVRHRQEDLPAERDRKSTRLNSSHVKISYAVFCLKKKNITLRADR